MRDLQDRAAQLPRAGIWLISLPLLVVGVYWSATYSGLYRALAEWQIHRFGDFDRGFTGFIVLAVCFGIGAILVQVAGALRAADRGPEAAAERAALAAARRADLSAWLHSRRKRLTALTAAGLVTGAGILAASRGLLAGERVRVDAAAIEHGVALEGRDVEITGRLVGEQTISYTDRKTRRPTLYIPLVSHEWTPGQPVRAYLEIWEPRLERDAALLATGRYQGMLSINSLPGTVVTTMADRGKPVADRYWVLAFGHTAEMDRNAGQIMFRVGVFIGLLTAIWWAIVALRTRARQAT